MNTLYKCPPEKLQLGDLILVKQHTWTLKNIVGPDRIGTYELYMQDSFGNYKSVITTEPITILV
jgi:hypothetical protein